MTGIDFRHAPAFWAGVVAITAGVVLHFPMFVGAADMHYRLAGMSPDAPMLIGMALIVLGLGAVVYGLVGRAPAAARSAGPRVSVRALDDAPLKRSHIVLILVMSVAVTIDAMKPITLGFVVPGMAKEYGLKSTLNPHGDVPVALLPLFGLGGTLLGSFLWGWLGDVIGRRASILLAGVLFIATAICGAMPSYEWNFAMCFLMGLGVGGMLPITFTLIAELLPGRHRGWAMVIVGGELALAYVLTSALTSALTPTYGWRILWLIGLPTGVLLVALQRFIPESPRFLLLRGRAAEATAVMERYCAEVVEPGEAAVGSGLGATGAVAGGAATSAVDGGAGAASPAAAPPWWRRDPRHTAIVVLLALAAGLVTYGFQLWIPTNLEKLGFDEVTSAGFLRDSALLGLPVTIVSAALYALWSTRGTILLLALLTAAASIGFAIAGNDVVDNRTLLHVLLAVPTALITSLLAAVLAYATELYPTSVRSRATGLAAGLSKAGGVALTALVAAAVAPPSIRETALIGAIPLVMGVAVLAAAGLETRTRSLEEIETEALTAPAR